MLGDLAAVQDPVGPHGDLVLAAQRPPGPRAGRGDLGQVGFGGGQQAFALAGPLGFQERVLAGHQPLAGEVRGGDLGQVLGIEQGQLQVPAADQLLDLGGAQRGDPVQVSGGDVLAQPGGGQHAPVPDQHHLGDPEPVLDLGHLGGHGRRVAGVALEDLDGDRDALGGGQQPVDDLQPARTPSLGWPMAPSGQVRPSNAAEDTSYSTRVPPARCRAASASWIVSCRACR